MKVTPRPEVLNPELTRPKWTPEPSRPRDKLWLDKNENTDPILAEFTKDIFRSLSPEALFTYPENGPLYAKIAKSDGLKPENILLCAGSDGAIRMTFETFVGRGDKVVHTAPTFAMYSVYCKMYGADTTVIDYRRGAAGPELSIEDLIETARRVKPKLFCLPNPDSPTGTFFSEAELVRLIETCAEVGAAILVDEAYYPFHPLTVASWINKYSNLIIARTFAKAWGLAGLRFGYAIACEEVTGWMHKMRPMYEVNTVAIAFMEKMIDHPEVMHSSVRRLSEGKNYFLGEMKKLGFATLNGGGNFLHVAFAEKAEKIHAALDSIVLYRKNFTEPCLKGFSRFSSTTVEQFKPIVEAIRAAC
jgi:histidinol-phosphate aminotransferase